MQRKGELSHRKKLSESVHPLLKRRSRYGLRNHRLLMVKASTEANRGCQDDGASYKKTHGSPPSIRLHKGYHSWNGIWCQFSHTRAEKEKPRSGGCRRG